MIERLGIVIGIEGGDGTGKTSTAKAMVEHLKEKGLSAIYVPLIEGSAVGKIYKSEYTTDPDMDAYRQCTGMLYSVMSTLSGVIEPMRKVYDVVIVDRTLASFHTYQILTNKFHFMIDIFDRVMKEKVYTDYYTLYLTVSPEKAIERMNGRGALDVIESKGIAYQSMIQSNYKFCFDTYEQLKPTRTIDTTNRTAREVQLVANDWVNTLIKTITKQNTLQPA